MKLLKEYAYYPTDRIDISSLDRKTYIGVDNILKNKEGICESEYLPRSGTFTKFKRGDVLIGNIRPYFKKIWLATFAGGASADVVVLRPKNIENSMFIYCNLMQDSFFDYVMSGYKGSKMPRGDKNHILNFPIPDINNKHEIAKLIYKFGEKINVNKRINDNLYQQIQTIYDYWFTQFDFPDKDGKPYHSSGGEMVHSNVLNREIPLGWTVGSIVNNPLSSVIKPGVYLFDSKEYLATSEVNGTNISKGSIVEYSTRESRANMQPTVNSVWFAKMKNSVKHLYLNKEMKSLIDNTILSTGFCGIQCTDRSFEYISSFVGSIYFETLKDILSHGATQEAVNNDDMESICFPIPSESVLKKYHELTRDMYAQISKNVSENRILTELRDWLLPMLMNGQVTIAD